MEKMTICLNMIVKDESKIILNTLNNLIENIKLDYWVICDTGSSDNTRELIVDFFKEKDISGELHNIPWKNFAYNRTKALELAYKKTDFIFIFDADDRIRGNLILPKLEHGYAYKIQFGHNLKWKRLCLIDNHLIWYYEGVMHELIGTKEEYKVFTIEGEYHIATNVEVSARNKKGPQKFVEDAKILEKAYENKDHLQMRYAFYAGECYRFSGKENWDKSIKWYKIAANGDKTWPQERYWACYQIGNIYRDLDEKEKCWYWWFKSYQFDTTRQEAFFELIKECRSKNKFKTGYNLYKMLDKMEKEDIEHKLFIIPHIYDHSLYSEMLIILFYLKKFDEANDILKLLFNAKTPIKPYIELLNFNLTFFLPYIKKDDWELYAKFQRYSKKYDVPDKLIKSIDNIFI